MFTFLQELKELNHLSKNRSLPKSELAARMEKIELPPFLAFISKYATSLEVTMMWSIPVLTSFFVLEKALKETGWLQFVLVGLIPFVFVFSFVIVGGLFAAIGKFGVIEGKFPRSYKHPIYAVRRIYGTAWTQLYYFKPIYSLCLSIPWLKAFVFRIYGFKGDLSFVTYPDSWIRDLPLLEIGKNVYLANRCVVGTNLCLNDSSILVGRCSFADNSMVGHLAIFGLGCKIGRHSEIGVNAGLGIRVTIKENSSIGPMALVYHGSEIGNRVKVGAGAVVGVKCKIADEITIKPGAIIPPGSMILTQAEADQLFAGETKNLIEEKETLFKELMDRLKDESTIRTT